MCLLQQLLVAMVEGTAFPVRAFGVLVLQRYEAAMLAWSEAQERDSQHW